MLSVQLCRVAYAQMAHLQTLYVAIVPGALPASPCIQARMIDTNGRENFLFEHCNSGRECVIGKCRVLAYAENGAAVAVVLPAGEPSPFK